MDPVVSRYLPEGAVACDGDLREAELLAVFADEYDALAGEGDWASVSDAELAVLFADEFAGVMDPGPLPLVEPASEAVPDAEAWAARVRALAAVAPSAGTLAELAGIDPGSLADPLDRVRWLQAVDKARGLVDALANTGLVAVAGAASSRSLMDERQVEHEVQVARRCSSVAAGLAIETARELAGDYAATAAALAAGEVTAAHAAVLVRGTRPVSSPVVRRAVEARVLPRASRMTPGELVRAVAAAVADLDVAAATDRHVSARAERSVTLSRGEDGMGYLGVYDTWTRVHALHRRLTAKARKLQLARGGATAASSDPDARLDACRADALTAAVLGTAPRTQAGPNAQPGPDGQPSPEATESVEPVEPVLVGHLVIDLDTLTGAADRHALLDGQSIPAPLARHLAAGTRAWRRMVTDPVTGHLLDLGATVYLNDAIRAYVFARDAVCVAPGCGQPASRCQADHHSEHPVGPTASANMGPLCVWHHQLKTDRRVFVTPLDGAGQRVWTTGWGQQVVIPPRPVLDIAPNPLGPHPDPGAASPPDTPPPDTPPPDTDDPPF